MASDKKKHSLAGISARNKKEIVPSKPLPKVSDAQAQTKDLDEITKGLTHGLHSEPEKKPVPAKKLFDEPEGDYKEVDKDIPYENPLPALEVTADSDAIKKALYAMMNLWDKTYFTVIRRENICSQKFSRDCLSKCQHFSICSQRAEIRNLIRLI